MAIAREVLDEIRSKVDMVDFLESRGTTFQSAGHNLKALCPVHSERSPSFNVQPEQQRFHCFGCGISGDIFELVEVMENLTFFGAAQLLADLAKVDITNEEQDEKYRATKRLYDIVGIASAWFRHEFKRVNDEHPAKKNFADRNLLERAKEDEMIGFAPNGGLLTILHKAGYTTAEIFEAGIVKPVEHEGEPPVDVVTNNTEVIERFRNRIMWTVCDVSGRPIGFSGRRIDDTSKAPKYLNSPQTPLYNKSTTLLGLQDAKKEIVSTQTVYVVEGQTDVMAFQAAGFMNVVASCGTSFGGLHASVLQRLANTGRSSEKFKFMFAFDADSAGVKAATTISENIPTIQLNSYVVTMAPLDDSGKEIVLVDAEGKKINLDPCDLRLKYGDDGLQRAVGSNVSLIEFILKQELNKWDLRTAEDRTGFIQAAKVHISHVKDPLQYDSYLRKIAFWSGVPYSQITSVLSQSRNRTTTVEENVAQPSLASLSPEDRIMAYLLQYPTETKAAFEKKAILPELFPDPAKLIAAYNDADPGANPLMYYDLGVTEDRVEATVEHLLGNYMKARYMEESAQLSARIAVASSDLAASPDGSLLLELMTEQLALKKKFSQ